MKAGLGVLRDYKILPGKLGLFRTECTAQTCPALPSSSSLDLMHLQALGGLGVEGSGFGLEVMVPGSRNGREYGNY